VALVPSGLASLRFFIIWLVGRSPSVRKLIRERASLASLLLGRIFDSAVAVITLLMFKVFYVGPAFFLVFPRHIAERRTSQKPSDSHHDIPVESIISLFCL
jgi:hypothetical protein